MKPARRLSKVEIRSLIADLAADTMSYAKLGKKYGVSDTTVRNYERIYFSERFRDAECDIFRGTEHACCDTAEAVCPKPERTYCEPELTTQTFKIGVDVDAMVFAALIDTADKIARNVADNTYDSVYDSTMETLCARYNIERGKYDVPKV